MTARALKRATDVTAASAGLLLLAPLLAAVAIAVRVGIGAPVLFRQTRPGLHAQPFRIIKFRTMRPPQPGEPEEKSDDARLTRLGIALRRTSLDELPELWNVLRGDMSLVGPRPLLTRYLPYYTDRERLRFTVRPGITGLAQIRGRNRLSWDERLALDVWYVENWSLLLDLRIVVHTLLSIFRRGDVVADARSVMLNLDEERASAMRGNAVQ